MITERETFGGELCFLLDVIYMGRTHRFSNVPIDLEDITTGNIIRYNGGLSDPEISQNTNFLGLDVEADSVSIELVFNNIDWIKEWLAGRTLEVSECVISAIVIKDQKTSFTIQSKIDFFKGNVTSPIFGDPTKPKGWIAFSIENSLNVKDIKFISSENEITRNKFPNTNLDSIYGKIGPFVFGKPGIIASKNGRTSLEFVEPFPSTPAYKVLFDRDLGPPVEENARFLIAYHEVEATIGRIYDPVGGSFRNFVLTDVDDEGKLYSYINYRMVGGTVNVIEDNNFQFLAVNPDGDSFELFNEFWASWGEEAGGYTDNNGLLTGGGDICLFVLDKLGLAYDFNSWSGLLTVLNEYKFSGYINDPVISYWDWLKDNIIRYLPIEVTNSAKGITPRLNLYFYSQVPLAQYHITTSSEFEIITAIQPMEEKVVNKLIVKMCYSSSYDAYQTTFTIDPTVEEEEVFLFNDPIAKLSYHRFGLMEEVLELPFVWDLKTAIRIARDQIRIRALGAKAIEISASHRYSYLEIGDVISLSSDIGLENHKVQVISKTWENNRWKFVLHIEENTLLNPR